jgi:hypothetical protein
MLAATKLVMVNHFSLFLCRVEFGFDDFEDFKQLFLKNLVSILLTTTIEQKDEFQF